MHILIAPDSFKGSISATEAARAIMKGLIKSFPKASFKILTLSDGGEGFIESIAQITDLDFINIQAENPIQRHISTEYGIIKDKKIAIIEAARTAGYQLINEENRNPLYTSSFGLGMQLKHALDSGYRKYIIGLTNDAGSGMLQALGMRIKDKNRSEIKKGGIYLSEVYNIESKEFHPAIKESHFTIACDINNPLTGPDGASMHTVPKSVSAL